MSRFPASRGFVIIGGIFMLILIAALIALMLTLAKTQNVAAAQDVQGSRAYQAARAGVEWAAYRLLQKNHCPFAGQSLPSLPGLTDFTVTVSCVADGAASTTDTNNTIWLITSTATLTGVAVGNVKYVERELKVTIEGHL